jgi:hypothetical protein
MRTPNKQTNAPKNKGGRPPKVIDADLVEKLCMIHCTDEEIADIVGVSVDTLARRRQQDTEFATMMAGAKGRGRASLRRIQWKLAESGNAALAIWLGKQLLGQRDKWEDTSADSNQPLPWTD